MNKERKIVPCLASDLIKVLHTFNKSKGMFVAGAFDTPVSMNKYDEYNITLEDGTKKRNPNAKQNPFVEDGGVRCVTKKYKLISGFNYAKIVNERLVEEATEENFEPNFEAKENWYNLVNKFLAVHKNDPNKFYFRYFYLPQSITECDYFYKGNTIDRMMFDAWKKESSDYSNQGLDNPVRVQVVDINNIIELTLDGTTYVIVDPSKPKYWENYRTITQGKEIIESLTI